jgi:hypothetical protein
MNRRQRYDSNDHQAMYDFEIEMDKPFNQLNAKGRRAKKRYMSIGKR